MDMASFRKEYKLENLIDKGKLDSDPIKEFEKWMGIAIKTPEIIEPNAMTLCTASKTGWPSGRILLLKV